MECLYEISIVVKLANLLDTAPEELQETINRQRNFESDGDYFYYFEFTEKTFSLIPLCRKWLQEFDFLEIDEIGFRDHDSDDSNSAQLAMLDAPSIKGVTLIGASTAIYGSCSSCASEPIKLIDPPLLSIKI